MTFFGQNWTVGTTQVSIHDLNTHMSSLTKKCTVKEVRMALKPLVAKSAWFIQKHPILTIVIIAAIVMLLYTA